MTRALGQVAQRLLLLAGRPSGITAAEARREASIICSNFSDQLGSLYEAKHVTRRREGPHWRYFVGEEAAEAWEVAQGRPRAAERGADWAPYQAGGEPHG